MSRRRPPPPRPSAAQATPPARALAPVPQGGRLLPALALCALVAIAYTPLLGAGFIWDDDDYVTENPALRSLAGLGRIWLEPGATPQYYPLTFTSLWVEYRLYADRPTGYHVGNVLLHALNAVLVWLILRRLRLPGAWLAAAVFALHPVHVESVAWITERKNVLSGACYLAALLVALGPTDAPPHDAAGRARRGALVIALFVAALLAKTVTCTLPVVLLLLGWWRRGTLTRRDLVATLPLFVLGAGLALVTVWMERTHVGATGALFGLSPVERILIAGRALWFYVATLVWPYPLVFVYPRWTIDPGLWWQWSFPLAATTTIVVLWLLRGRLGRGPLTAVLAFTVTLLPALGFIDVYPMRYTFVADHYQYLASLALIAPATAWLTRRLGASSRSLGVGTAVLGLAVLASLTAAQTRVYADQETLWRDVIAKNPSASMAHINLGMWLHQRGRSDEARTALEDALALEPSDEVHGDLGVVLAALGRGADARAHLEEAVRLAPGSALAHSNLGNALAADGRLAEAALHYREAIRLKPRYADAESNLANVLVAEGRTDEAIRLYQSAIATDPGYVAARYNLAVVLARLGRDDEALAQFRAVVDRDPGHAEAERGLGATLAARGEIPAALEHLTAATRLAPERADAHYQLGVALTAAGRIDEAVVELARATALRPDVADFHNDLGIAFARRGDRDAAIKEFQKAVKLAPDHAEASHNLAAALAPAAP